MNRKTIIVGIVILLIVSLGIIIRSQIIKKENSLMQKQEVKAELTSIPKFNFQDIPGNPFTNANLEKDKPTVVVHFGNFCPYCHEEAKIMSHYSEEYKDFQLLYVTKDEMDNINIFMNKHKLRDKLNLTILRYENNEFEEAFGSRSLPCVFIFDKHQKFVQHFDGAVTARTLIKYTRAANLK
ncbi:TlpA family protein disulfide reductase [Marinifilum sp. D737]|uniref:TlpA family protein disulfide reductase n=1 Tax=Marinifilum sp. D737 TaxID=2969628 RepID=UPI002274ED32|nr:TlpA disulfide reductase family protein [Marinifilum sp. D737]MCY1635376.1 TlpA family protein disulfide reductase [Marinifilum sp. D737]